MRLGKAIAIVATGVALSLTSAAQAAARPQEPQSEGLLSRLASDVATFFGAQDQHKERAYGVLPRPNLLPEGDGGFGQDFAFTGAGSAYGYRAGSRNLLDFGRLFWSDQFQSYRPFAAAMQTGFGPVEVSGYAVSTEAPYLLPSQLRSLAYHRHDLRDFQLSAAVMPGVMVNVGYNLDMAGRFNGYDVSGSSAYDGLFFSAAAVNSPYLSLADGGNFVGASFELADGLQAHFGASMLDPQSPSFEMPVFMMLDQLSDSRRGFGLRQASAAEAGMSWDFARWGGLGLTVSQTSERHGLLGSASPAAAALTRAAKTSAVGVSARFGLGDGWVTTFSYNEGITQLSLRPDSLDSKTDTLRSRAYGMAVAKHGLFSNSDALGLALSRPIHVYSGGAGLNALNVLAGVDPGNNLLMGREHISLATHTPETDVELGYVTTFFDGALALQANAGYQMNFAGQKGTNALTVLSRAKINF